MTAQNNNKTMVSREQDSSMTTTQREAGGREHDQIIKEAAQALSDLNTFAIMVSILEGGHLHWRLREYDLACLKTITAGTAPATGGG